MLLFVYEQRDSQLPYRIQPPPSHIRTPQISIWEKSTDNGVVQENISVVRTLHAHKGGEGVSQ